MKMRHTRHGIITKDGLPVGKDQILDGGFWISVTGTIEEEDGEMADDDREWFYTVGWLTLEIAWGVGSSPDAAFEDARAFVEEHGEEKLREWQRRLVTHIGGGNPVGPEFSWLPPHWDRWQTEGEK